MSCKGSTWNITHCAYSARYNSSMPSAPSAAPKQLPPPPAVAPGLKRLRLTSRADLLISKALSDPDTPTGWPLPIEAALSKLTIKQRQFVIRLASGQKKPDAYRICYNVSTTRQDSDLYSDIIAIERSHSYLHAKALLHGWMDRGWLSDALDTKSYIASRLYEEAEYAPKASERIAAANSLAKLAGLLVARSEVTVRDGNQSDRQEELIESLLGQLGVETAIDAEFERINPLKLKDLILPSLGTVCLRCKHHIEVVAMDVGYDGDGI